MACELGPARLERREHRQTMCRGTRLVRERGFLPFPVLNVAEDRPPSVRIWRTNDDQLRGSGIHTR